MSQDLHRDLPCPCRLRGAPNSASDLFWGRPVKQVVVNRGMQMCRGPKASGATAHGHLCSPKLRDAMLHPRAVSWTHPISGNFGRALQIYKGRDGLLRCLLALSFLAGDSIV